MSEWTTVGVSSSKKVKSNEGSKKQSKEASLPKGSIVIEEQSFLDETAYDRLQIHEVDWEEERRKVKKASTAYFSSSSSSASFSSSSSYTSQQPSNQNSKKGPEIFSVDQILAKITKQRLESHMEKVFQRADSHETHLIELEELLEGITSKYYTHSDVSKTNLVLKTTQETRKYLENFLKERSSTLPQFLSRLCVTLVKYENESKKRDPPLGKGIGIKLLIQLIASIQPSAFEKQIEIVSHVFPAYRIQPSNSETIRWIFDQVLPHSLDIAVKAWFSLFEPTLTGGETSAVAVQVMAAEMLVTISEKLKGDPSKVNKIFPPQVFVKLLVIAYSQNSPLSGNKKESEIKIKAEVCYNIAKEALTSTNKFKDYFAPIIELKYKSDQGLQKEAHHLLTIFLMKDFIYNQWKNCYQNSIENSTSLLSLLDQEWSFWSSQIPMEKLKETIQNFLDVNSKLSSLGGKDFNERVEKKGLTRKNLEESTAICNKILSRASSSSIVGMILTILILILIISVSSVFLCLNVVQDQPVCHQLIEIAQPILSKLPLKK